MSGKREEIALRLGLCKCNEAYTERGLVAPDCPYHSMCVTEAMDEYMKECVLEFIEYVAKNKIEINNDNGEPCCYLSNGEGITPKQLFENFL